MMANVASLESDYKYLVLFLSKPVNNVITYAR